MINLCIGLISIGCIMLIYLTYQHFRNYRVNKIRREWINTNDKRWNKYSYAYMYNPSKHNLYGFKFPKDKQFN